MNERFAGVNRVARVELVHEHEFALGALHVSPPHCEVAGPDWKETIEPRVMQVLVALAREHGGVVSRDELIEACWEGRVVGDDAIGRCIWRLRKLAERSGGVFTVETVSRVGYRLKVTARQPESQLFRTEQATADTTSSPLVVPAISARRTRIKWITALSTLVCVAAAVWVWRSWPTRIVPGPSRSAEASVAVLPFVNMSGDPKKDYFSDGFSEELVNDLSNTPYLRVASRTSSFVFKGRNEDISTIAQALRVHAIVEGSVRESGERVRITAQLIDAGSGYHLWSATYDRNMSDILAVEGEIGRAIASALTHRLVPAAPRPRIDPAVYRLYLEGIHELNQTPPDSYRRSLPIFRLVTERAPDFADGFARLSVTALSLANSDEPNTASYYAVSSNAAQRALLLDPHNVHARFDRAILELYVWDWRGAATDLRVLRAQQPKSRAYLNGLRNYFDHFGFNDEELAVWNHLLAIEPQTDANRYVTLWTLANAGHFQEEIDIARAMLTRQHGDTEVLNRLCAAYAALGRTAEARATAQRLRELRADFDKDGRYANCNMDIDLASGNQSDARRLLRTWESRFPDKLPWAGDIGKVYVELGDFEKASEWFERAYERRESEFFGGFYERGFGAEQAFEKYRQTSEYRALAVKPLFKEWQAEHDRIAAALAAHRDPLN